MFSVKCALSFARLLASHKSLVSVAIMSSEPETFWDRRPTCPPLDFVMSMSGGQIMLMYIMLVMRKYMIQQQIQVETHVQFK